MVKMNKIHGPGSKKTDIDEHRGLSKREIGRKRETEKAWLKTSGADRIRGSLSGTKRPIERLWATRAMRTATIRINKQIIERIRVTYRWRYDRLPFQRSGALKILHDRKQSRRSKWSSVQMPLCVHRSTILPRSVSSVASNDRRSIGFLIERQSILKSSR